METSETEPLTFPLQENYSKILIVSLYLYAHFLSSAVVRASRASVCYSVLFFHVDAHLPSLRT